MQQAPPPSTNPWGNSGVPSSAFNPFQSLGNGGGGVVTTDPWSSTTGSQSKPFKFLIRFLAFCVTVLWNKLPPPHPHLHVCAVSSSASDPFSDIRGPDFDSVFGKSHASVGPTPSAVTASQLGGVLQPTSASRLATPSVVKQQKPSSDANNSLSGLLGNLGNALFPPFDGGVHAWGGGGVQANVALYGFDGGFGHSSRSRHQVWSKQEVSSLTSI